MLVVLAAPIATVLAGGELHSPEIIAQLTACIAVIGVSQVFGGSYEIGRQALFARLDVRGSRLATDVGTLLGVAVGLAALLAVPAARPALLCGAVVVRDATATVMVLTRLRRSLRPRRLLSRRALLATLAAGAIAVPVALGTRAGLGALAPSGTVAALVALAAAGLIVVVAYVGALQGALRLVGRGAGRPTW